MHDARPAAPPARSHSRTERLARTPPWLLRATVLLGLFFLVLAIRVRSTVGPLGLDRWVSQHLVPPDGNGIVTAHVPAAWIADVGAPTFVWVMTAVTLAWAVRGRDWHGAFLAVAGPALAYVCVESLLKPIVARRISGDNQVFVFPSGTVSLVTASGVVTVVLVSRWFGRARAVLAAALLCGVVLVTCLAVIALGWHYATDAIGGVVVGGAVVLAVAWLSSAAKGAVRGQS